MARWQLLEAPMASPEKSQSEKTAEDSGVPKAVVSRLSLYLRELQHLLRDGNETTSSTQLGSRLGVTDAQIRKDLAYFGQFGYPGIGYRCEELVSQIRKILGTDHDWAVAIVGLGNLGTALLGHRGFANQGFRVVAGFDTDPNKIGTEIHSVPIYDMSRLGEIVERESIRLAILAVPADVAQEAADGLVEVGIHGIMNFTPVTVTLPETVSKVAVDLAIELEQLSFAVVNSRQNS